FNGSFPHRLGVFLSHGIHGVPGRIIGLGQSCATDIADGPGKHIIIGIPLRDGITEWAKSWLCLLLRLPSTITIQVVHGVVGKHQPKSSVENAGVLESIVNELVSPVELPPVLVLPPKLAPLNALPSEVNPLVTALLNAVSAASSTRAALVKAFEALPRACN